MKRTLYLALAVGIGLFVALIAYNGGTQVAAAVAAAGWGLAWVTLFHLVPLALDTAGWWGLGRVRRLSFPAVALARWIGESVNNLLPVGQIGGNLVRARLVAGDGLPGVEAGATVVVDLTLTVLTQLLFTLLGLALFLFRLGGAAVTTEVLTGVVLGAAALLGFYIAQRRGLFTLLARLLEGVAGGRAWLSLVGGAVALDEEVVRLYGGRGAVARSAALHLAAWIAGAGEVWLALRLLGHPVGWGGAIILESLGQAVRSSAFAVPGALGVQEGGFLLLGRMLGLTPEIALAVSLVKRVRELALGLPGLVAWPVAERSRQAADGAEVEG